MLLLMPKGAPISWYVIWRSCFIRSCTTSMFSSTTTMLDDIHGVRPRVIVGHDWIRYTSFLRCCRRELYVRPRQKLPHEYLFFTIYFYFHQLRQIFQTGVNNTKNNEITKWFGGGYVWQCELCTKNVSSCLATISVIKARNINSSTRSIKY